MDRFSSVVETARVIVWIKIFTKREFKKNLTNLIEKNDQINITLIILFQAITRSKATWMLKVSTCFFHCSSCAKHGDFASARVTWTYKGDINSNSGELQEKTWKQPSTLTVVSFDGYILEKILMLAIKENKWDIKYM